MLLFKFPATRIATVITTDQLDSTINDFSTICGGGWQSISLRSNVAPEMLRAPGALETSQMHFFNIGKRIDFSLVPIFSMIETALKEYLLHFHTGESNLLT
jgi:hypothetical protein